MPGNEISMRNQFVATLEHLFEADERLVLLLGDISVYGFSQLIRNYGDRAFNIGILEQSTISMASGLSISGFIPVFHTIAPFIVERGYEQLKIDFGYQNQCGNFVSIGASYDEAGLGCTHHCPADIGILKLIPNVSIVVPGTSSEFNNIFEQAYANAGSRYFRLSNQQNDSSLNVEYGKANLIRRGKKALVVVVGNLLTRVSRACEDFDISMLYVTTVKPFDFDGFRDALEQHTLIIICEPYYSEGGVLSYVVDASQGRQISINSIGMRTVFSNHYGTIDEHDDYHGLTEGKIRAQIRDILLRGES
jgi:transketolase